MQRKALQTQTMYSSPPPPPTYCYYIIYYCCYTIYYVLLQYSLTVSCGVDVVCTYTQQYLTVNCFSLMR